MDHLQSIAELRSAVQPGRLHLHCPKGMLRKAAALVPDTIAAMIMQDETSKPVAQHHLELARAGAAALQKHYQEAIDIASELLTSGIYDELARQDPEAARRARAETRLMLGTAMHYNDAHYEDIVRVLKSTLDSPPDIAKDAYFTLAVVHLSFENPSEAAAAMRRALELIEELRRSGDSDLRLAEQEEEAREFFQQMAQSDPKKN